MAIERMVVLFSGRVQGVGFRQTTVEIARAFPLAGTVRNLSDGRVELMVEGAPENINFLLRALREAFRECITAEQKNSAPVCGEKAPVRIAW